MSNETGWALPDTPPTHKPPGPVNPVQRTRLHSNQTGPRLLALMGMVAASTAQAHDWGSFNRSLSLHATALRQDYRETDTQGLTANGTLNAERGTVGGRGLQARWQGHLGGLPLWAQADGQWAQGQTDYDGYLQSGSTLTPFKARTCNTWRSQSLALGVPLDVGTGERFQLIPHLQWASQHWQRNLVQYGETYRDRSAGLGLLLQGAATERLTLEALAARRWQSRASVSVPAFDFAAEQGRGKEDVLGLTARWQAGRHWHLMAGANLLRFENGASPVVQGLQAPPNTHKTLRVESGVGLNF